MSFGTGAIREASRTIFWENHRTGEVMLAPATNVRPFRGWVRKECQTVAETEQFSRRLARLEFNKYKMMRVEEHLRSAERRRQLIANCRLRLASGCISAADEEATRRILKNQLKKEELFYQFLAEKPDYARGHLAIEAMDDSAIRQKADGKRRGVDMGEMDSVSKLLEATA